MANDGLSLMDRVREAANAVPDPCSMARNLNLGVADMGMIRNIRLEEVPSGRWSVTMLIRLTAPGCMYMPYFEEHLRREVTRLPDVDEFRIVWDDNFDWTPECLSPAAKEKVAARTRHLEEVLRYTERADCDAQGAAAKPSVTTQSKVKE
ncbi:MAG: hypothetical protein APF78_03690 [Sphingomonadales bacterium BRH_c3]|nr:MAG: hypothetical protein APF78_03690 [Sphingomonadales bacterium BRH_c3]